MSQHLADPIDLRTGMRRIASSVAVITSRSNDGSVGITATSVTSVSMDPPAILVCVNRSARLCRTIANAGQFRVNYLASDQQEIAATFGGKHSFNRFAVGKWAMEADCGPMLEGAVAQMTCTLDQAIEYGTHTIFIGAVQSVQVEAQEPLLYCNGGYASLAA